MTQDNGSSWFVRKRYKNTISVQGIKHVSKQLFTKIWLWVKNSESPKAGLVNGKMLSKAVVPFGLFFLTPPQKRTKKTVLVRQSSPKGTLGLDTLPYFSSKMTSSQLLSSRLTIAALAARLHQPSGPRLTLCADGALRMR